MGEEVMVVVLHRQRNIIEESEVQQAFLFTTDANGNGTDLGIGGNMAETINEGKDKTAGADAKGHLLTLHHPKSDGSFHIATPVDPIFIFLPIFADACFKKGTDPGRFRQIDEILYVEGYPGYQHLMRMAEVSMQLVCEVKEVGLSKFFRLDDSKVLSWLYCKVHHLKASLEKLDKNYAIQDEKETLKEVVSILGDYMKHEPWLTNLCIHLKLSLEDALLKANSSSSGKVDAARTRSSNGKQPKKLKTETDSRNIKDVFRLASKRRS